MYTTIASMGKIRCTGYNIKKVGCGVFLAMGQGENIKKETSVKITQAFWELYKTKKIEKITVKNITDVCGIYRTTFYLHFSDIYAILEQIEKRMLEQLEQVECTNTLEQYFMALFQHFEKESLYLKVLLDEHRHPEFAEQYKTRLMKKTCELKNIDLQMMGDREQIVVYKTISMLIDLLMCWIDTELFSVEEAMKILDGYMHKGIAATFGQLLSLVENNGRC